MSSSLRQFNSVVSHLRMLADLVRARAVSGDDRLEAALHELASGLDPKNGSATTAAAIPAAGAAAPNDRPSGRRTILLLPRAGAGSGCTQGCLEAGQDARQDK